MDSVRQKKSIHSNLLHGAPSSQVWQSRRVKYLFFTSYGLAWSMSIIAPGWGSVNLSRFTHHPPKFGYFYRGGRGGMILTLIHWLGPPFFSAVIRTPRRQWGSNPQSLDCRSKLLPTELKLFTGEYKEFDSRLLCYMYYRLFKVNPTQSLINFKSPNH